MNIVASSGWLAYFADEPNAKHFLPPLSDSDSLVVPTVTIYEVFKVVLRESIIEIPMLFESIPEELPWPDIRHIPTHKVNSFPSTLKNKSFLEPSNIHSIIWSIMNWIYPSSMNVTGTRKREQPPI